MKITDEECLQLMRLLHKYIIEYGDSKESIDILLRGANDLARTSRHG